MVSLPLTDRYIIAARLKGYLSKHAEAVALLTEALEQEPGSARLLRFRGHRRISIRDYTGAIEDLRTAAAQLDQVEDEYEMYQPEVEKDIVSLILGRPEAVRPQHLSDTRAAADPQVLGRYMATLHTSVWYHLGVAQYLRGDFADCLPSFREAERTSRHQEGTVAALDWQYMALRRLGRAEEAEEVLDRFREVDLVTEDHYVGYENRMRLYTGDISPEELQKTLDGDDLRTATEGYGLGNWYYYRGDTAKAREVFDAVLRTGVSHSFAYLAVQAEYSRNPDFADASAPQED
ncbi:Tetratricopeptide repeat-containing protein [Sinosporangium album]|uniref:Tetratricopeptide repeat-containing protein n=1 Tax=Sinosporangium album TaxID=504805 RepID=A0A1G7QQF1_9ACTN|nr:tetratricopeptide repeat protein [Sinosporangium album]SDG00766.1 Tetratricopeptide repeat-containing protein [Sinosporangium album]